VVIGELKRQVVVSDLLPLAGIVGDPNDEMILACTVAASTPHVVARDKNLLSLGNYKVIVIVTPETFLTLLGNAES
jgi:predicted nucleic acid-binding protein